MSSSTSRVLRLAELLQSADVRTVAELADQLEVNERTVRRYVERLLELDIPVESVRGRYGGYRIGAGYRMAPVVLNDEEAAAVVLGLVRAQSSADAPEIAAQTAMSKIRRSLPAESARRVDALLETVVLGAPAHHDVPDGGILLALADAVRRRSPLELRYHDADGTPSRRTVHPAELLARSGRWYLLAFDTTRQDERTFRVDRIRTARALSGTFTPPLHDGDAVSRLVEGFADADYPWHVVLRIRASEEHIRAQLPTSVAVLRPVDDGARPDASSWRRAEIRAKRLDWLPAVIAALDCEVVIDAPEELRNAARAAAAALLRAADAAGEDARAGGPA